LHLQKILSTSKPFQTAFNKNTNFQRAKKYPKKVQPLDTAINMRKRLKENFVEKCFVGKR